MNKEQKRKLRNISLLALVGLIGGTFAFTAFNQQAINDRLRDNEFEVGGRVHDYYNRDTENKDVFVENFGQTPIMARIRLSEFMEIQRRGETEFEPVVPDTERETVSTWSTYIPSGDNLNTRTGEGAVRFNQYSKLTFGWEREGQYAPWYLPTFNHVTDDHRSAAAGHARDYFTSNATDGITNGATHPGDGTDAYWTEDSPPYDNSDGDWFGSPVTREVAQNLPQQKPPMTLQEWDDLPNEQKIGDFWVIDHTTGWAYWASQLQVGETTSYLLDAAEMEPAADAINGSYYYGIHVTSGLASLDESEEFLIDGETHDSRLEVLLEGIRNNAVDDEGNNGGGLPTENPDYDVDSAPGDFNFGLMNPGRLFTIDNQRFRYLENMGDGNHMIIRNFMIPSLSWNEQPARLQSWYTALIEAEPTLEPMVQPVDIPNPVPGVADENISWSGNIHARWRPVNLSSFPEVANDFTTVDKDSGSKQAFALSLAEVSRMSTGNGPFNTADQRSAGPSTLRSGWMLRTPGGTSTTYWSVRAQNDIHRSSLFGNSYVNSNTIYVGMRPALIIHQVGT
ncbi:hypothetical protein [Lactococcus formosensis]|uniref:hypothetical protein n=1 Tax=Lactococcus formosensis TaxID=1281486 RepID=UPI001F070892|nr:hypothetical protein [Lactococcus formosensis]MCH1723464.1 hypothetical protein [Lactococcus formosensis]MDG6113417.1 hypothetical protein [Lactococcus formosensis]MDG6116470.1 hypothetical protein [Lactococcus formosensis]MDG6121652.1 hypothetical protein [Lactococcus formosensis]MDG6123213.1 hypothetical protein [Lactococcus formosensis]